MEYVNLCGTYLVHNFSHLKDLSDQNSETILISNIFRLFRFLTLTETDNRCSRFGFVEATGELGQQQEGAGSRLVYYVLTFWPALFRYRQSVKTE